MRNRKLLRNIDNGNAILCTGVCSITVMKSFCFQKDIQNHHERNEDRDEELTTALLHNIIPGQDPGRQLLEQNSRAITNKEKNTKSHDIHKPGKR